METNKWIVDNTFAYTLHESGRFVKGEPELCNKFYFRVYPDYAHGITDEDAAKVVSELIRAKEERDLLIQSLNKCLTQFEGIAGYGSREDYIAINEAKQLLINLKK